MAGNLRLFKILAAALLRYVMKQSINRNQKLKGRILPAAVAALLFMQLTFPYHGWIILLVGLGGVWLLSYVWAKSLTHNLNFNREIRFGWAHVGDRLEERFTLINHGFIPALWVEVTDHSTIPDYTANLVTGIDGQNSNRWHTHGTCTARGIFTLGPTTLRAGDPFGLYSVTINLPQTSTLTVTPPIVPLPSIEVASGGRVGEGRSRPNPFERTVSSTGVRQYNPGDSLNRIHWPTTARLGEYFVRQFDSTPSGDWWIFLDLDEQVQVGKGFASTEEHSIILSASLADRGLRAGRAVGLVTYGRDMVWLPPESGDVQHKKIMRALAQINPGAHPLTDLLAKTQPVSRKVASLIIITPNVNGSWIEGVIPLIQRGAIPTVLLLDPVSFGSDNHENQIQPTLAELNIAHHIITPDLLDRPEARPGQQGQWQWRISPTGRAIAVNRPRDMGWKSLG